MGILVLSEESRNAAIKDLQRHEAAFENWKKSAERERLMKVYPGEYIAVRDGKVIEHFKEMEKLFVALIKRKNKHENLLLILTDRLVPTPTKRSEIIAQIDDFDKRYEKDPTMHALCEVRRRANALTQKELNMQFTI
jgi:dihydroxyacetone kinase-like predicted kinase